MSSLATEAGAARGRAAAAAVLGAVVLAALVALGRWEAEQRVEAEVEGMARTLAAVGALDSPSLTGYRVLHAFDCVVYRRGETRFALEVCVDEAGRVVETIDRRGSEHRVHSLRDDPDASTLRVERALVDALLRRMGAPCCR